MQNEHAGDFVVSPEVFRDGHVRLRSWEPAVGPFAQLHVVKLGWIPRDDNPLYREPVPREQAGPSDWTISRSARVGVRILLDEWIK